MMQEAMTLFVKAIGGSVEALVKICEIITDDGGLSDGENEQRDD